MYIVVYYSSTSDAKRTEQKGPIDWAALHAGRAEAVAKKWSGTLYFVSNKHSLMIIRIT